MLVLCGNSGLFLNSLCGLLNRLLLIVVIFNLPLSVSSLQAESLDSNHRNPSDSNPESQGEDFDQTITRVAEKIIDDVSRAHSECSIRNENHNYWFDDIHRYFNQGFCTPAAWFDGFFSDERVDDEVQPGSRIRWQNDYIENEFGESEYTTKLRGSFKLPKASKNLRLIFEGDPEDSVEDIVPDNSNDTESQVGLLYEVTQSPRANVSLRLSLSPRATLRYRYKLPVSETFTTQFIQQVSRDEDDWSVRTQLDLIEKISTDLVLRQSNRISRSESDDFSIWRTSLVLFQRVSPTSALSYESSYSGVTEPETFSTNSRVAVRFRQQFFRPWLFYEIAPEVTWPREFPDQVRETTRALFVRLEVNFVNL